MNPSTLNFDKTSYDEDYTRPAKVIKKLHSGRALVYKLKDEVVCVVKFLAYAHSPQLAVSTNLIDNSHRGLMQRYVTSDLVDKLFLRAVMPENFHILRRE